MRNFFQYIENFFFRCFDFSGRASPMEYWCVMPLIWLVILALVPGDAAELWSFLLARQVPPLNPLYYDSILVFVLTLIPRLSLTVRRLHDSGKSGKWVKLPFIAVSSGITLTLGATSAMLTASVGSNDAVLGGAIVLAIIMGSAGSAWNGIFMAAAAANALGWDVIWATLSDMTGTVQRPQVNAGISNIGQGFADEPGMTVAAVLVMTLMICTPFLSAFFHLMFMIAPSSHKDDAYGGMLDPAPMRGPKKSLPPGQKPHDPLVGYACLFERTPEQDAALKIKQKEELKNLYQSRVLGRG